MADRQKRVAEASDTRTAVLIAAFNAEATLDRAVSSALAQPETSEVCIVDDASSDGTARLGEAWAARDPRVLYVRMGLNVGPAACRNAAFERTRAPWIAILDADDYLLPGRLGVLHRHAGGADFVADALIRTQEGRVPAPAAVEFAPRRLDFLEFVLGNLGALKGPLDLGYLKPMFRRAFVEAHGLRYQEQMRLGEDYELYARALALGARFLVGAPAGYVSIERAGSLSKDHGEADLQRLRDCDGPIAAIRVFSHQEKKALRRHWDSVDCRLQWVRLIRAVKTRDLPLALATFHTPQTCMFLSARLIEQAWLRSVALLRGNGRAQVGARA